MLDSVSASTPPAQPNELRARIPALPTLRALTAGIIIDSLGRRWDPLKHPRDRKGRFIETFAEIRAFMKGKSYGKSDFTGRIIAVNQDNTAIVQISAGRGDYAKMKGRLARVPLGKVEVADYKAKIGGPELRKATPPEAEEINKVVTRLRDKDREVPGLNPDAPAADQLNQVEAIAEAAEDAGDTANRDRLLDIKGAMRGDPSREEIAKEVKAVLHLPDDADADRGAQDAPDRPEPSAAPDSDAGPRRDDGGVPSPGDGGTPESEVAPPRRPGDPSGNRPDPDAERKEKNFRDAVEKAEKGKITPDSSPKPPADLPFEPVGKVKDKKAVRPQAELKEPQTIWQAWGMMLGLWGKGDTPPSAPVMSRVTIDRNGATRVMPKSKVADYLKNLDLAQDGENVIVAFPDPSGNPDDPALRISNFNIAKLQDDPNPHSPANQLANDISDYIDNYGDVLEVNWPDLHESLINAQRALRDGDRDGFIDAWRAIPHDDWELLFDPEGHQEFRQKFANLIVQKDAGFQDPPPIAEITPTEWTDIDPARWAADSVDDDLGALLGIPLGLMPDDKAKLQGKLARFMRVHRDRVPQRVIRKGDLDIAIMHDASPELIENFQRAWEEVTSADPLEGRKIAVLNDMNLIRSDPNQNYKGVKAEAAAGGRVARFNIPILQDALDSPKDRPGKFLMPGAYEGDGYQQMKYTLTHEYGHMRGPNLMGQPGRSLAQELADAFTAAGDPPPSFEEWKKLKGRGDLPYRWSDFYKRDGSYGNGFEAYAEFYAEYKITNGESDSKQAQAFAKLFDLDSPVPADERLPEEMAEIIDLVPAADAERWDEIANWRPEDFNVAQAEEAMEWIAEQFDASNATLATNARTAFRMASRPRPADTPVLRGTFYEDVLLDKVRDDTRKAAIRNLLRKVDPQYDRRLGDAPARQFAFNNYVKGNAANAWRGVFRDGPKDWLDHYQQENLAAAVIAGGFLDDWDRSELDKLFPDANLAADRIEFLNKIRDIYNDIGTLKYPWYSEMLVFTTSNHRDDFAMPNAIVGMIEVIDDEGGDTAELRRKFADAFPDHDFAQKLTGLPAPDHDKDYVEKSPAADVAAPSPEDFEAGKKSVRETARNLAEEFFRGRSKGAKRGVGNLHLADRFAFDQDGNEIRKGDVVWFDEAPGKGKRPAADGYIQNIVVKTKKDADGNRRPVLDAAGVPEVTKVVVRHFDTSYIGADHPNPKLRELGQKWAFPYWDWEIANPRKVVRFIPDDEARAQAVVEQFGLHGRRMAGRGAGRFAPIVGKVFRLDRMRNAVPIQNRFLRDAGGKLIGEGDVIRYKGELYEVIRPNNPWDNSGAPRVMIRPVGGGALKQPVASNVEFVDGAKDGQMFFRGAGGIAAPKPEDISRVLRRHGIYDRDVNQAIIDGDFEALAKAIAANVSIQGFLDGEAADRKKIRDRIEIDNRGARVPPGHRPVGELEYMQAQDQKADAVILLAAKGGFFADTDGKPRDLDDKIRKDLYGDYVGEEADIRMRSAYGDVYDGVEAAVAVSAPEGEDADGLKERHARLNAMLVNVGKAGNARLNDSKERAQAQAALNRLSANADRLGDADLKEKVEALKEAIRVWGEEFDARNRGVTPAGAPAAPAAPRPAPEPVARPDTPTPTPEAEAPGASGVPGTPAGTGDMMEGLGIAGNAAKDDALDRPDDKFDKIDLAYLRPRIKFEAMGDEDFDWTDLGPVLDAVAKGEPIDDAELDKWIERFNAHRDSPAQLYPEMWQRFANVLVHQRGKKGAEKEPAAPEAPATPPKFNDDDVRAVLGRRRDLVSASAKGALEDIVAGREPDSDAVDELIRDLKKNIERFKDGDRDDPRNQFQNVLDAVQARMKDGKIAPAPAPEPKTPEPIGRTDAIEDVFEKADKRINDIRAGGDLAKAREVRRAADEVPDALDEAQAAHDAGSKEERDAALAGARDAADAIDAAGEPDLAREMRDVINGNAARFAEDDNRIEPMELGEGMDAVNDVFDPMRGNLRKDGPAGRKRARELQAEIDDIEGNLEAAEAADTDEERDELLQAAEVAAGNIVGELGEVLADVIKRNGERIRNKGKGDAGANPSDIARDPGLGQRGGDPAWVDDVDGDSPEALRFRQFAESIRGLGLNDIVSKINNGEVPGAVSIKRLNHKGLIGVQKVTMADGSVLIIKSDVEYEAGAPAEDVMARLARAAGMRAPMVAMLNPYGNGFSENENSPRGVLLMEFTGDLLRDDEQGIWDAGDVASGGDGAPRVDISNYKNYTDDGIRDLLGLALMDTAGRNPDRHQQNYQMAVTKDGKLRPVVIDNGRSLHWMEMAGYGLVDGSNMLNIQSSGPERPVQKWLASLSEDEARREMSEFLTRMRDRAEKIRTIEQRDNDKLVEQFQWALDNLDDMVRAWRR